MSRQVSVPLLMYDREGPARVCRDGCNSPPGRVSQDLFAVPAHGTPWEAPRDGVAAPASGLRESHRSSGDLMTAKKPSRSRTSKGDVTRLLEKWAEGDADARDRLFSMVLDELRAMARGALAREGRFHSLQPTDLVSEVCLKLLNQRSLHWESRAQFYAFSSNLMRYILVDHARRRLSAKRNGVRIPFNEVLGVPDERVPHILALEDALKDLETLDPLQARIVEMRLYGGWTIEEIAEALEIGSTTVKRRWSSARPWLRRYFNER